MKILIFTEGTILTHRSHIGLPRDKILELVRDLGTRPGPNYFASSVPIGHCVRKIAEWRKQGAMILYLTSRRIPEEVEVIRNVLSEYQFPQALVAFRREIS